MMTLGSYEHEMMDEVREARRALTKARLAEIDARTAFREAQAERATKERALEEILDAIATGDTGRGLFDRAAEDRRAREDAETADERQRGTTTAPKKSKAKLQGSARVPSATVQAADEFERVGCKPTIEPEDWSALWCRSWHHAATVRINGEIVEVPYKYAIRPATGGEQVKVEFSGPLQDTPYNEYALAFLVDGLPEMVPEHYRPRPHAYFERMARHFLRLMQSGDVVGTIADPPAWWDAPLSAVGKLTRPARDILNRCGCKTVGDLVDAFELDVDEVRVDPDDGYTRLIPDGASWDGVRLALDEYLDEAPGRRPAVEVMRWGAGDAPPDAVKPTIEPDQPRPSDALIDGLLSEALWPEGVSPSWSDVRKDGASDADVLDELREIWPDVRVFHARYGTPGFSTEGGEHPRFWIGTSLSSGAAPSIPTLAGVDLVAAVRRLLRIPTPEQLDAQVEQPKPKAKKAAKSKPKEAVR